MVFKEGQVFKVRDAKELTNNPKFRIDFSGNIFRDGEHVFFNDTMQNTKTITVKKTIDANSFLGEDDWYWYSWMLVLPNQCNLMITE